ncbi:MAG: hypothetical protein ABW133_13345 [Polyangiaceae bacterium]
MREAVILGCVVALASLAACSSEGDVLPKKGQSKPTTPDAGQTVDVAPDVRVEDVSNDGDGKAPRDPNANCVKPGTPRNDRDIGGYCEPGRGDCESSQGPRFCTADFRDIAPVEDDKWFCSSICTMNEECGMGALCAEAPGGATRGCVPVACFGDGGGGAVQGAGR